MRAIWILVLALSLVAAACSKKPPFQGAETLGPGLSPDQARRLRVAEVKVTTPADAPSELATILTERLRTETARCAKGDRPVRLEAQVEHYQDPVPYYGAQIQMAGFARVVDQENGRILGEYYVDQFLGTSPIARIIADTGSVMSRRWSWVICRNVFLNRLPEDNDGAPGESSQFKS